MADKVDILAFGAHADDVEIGMAASIAKWASMGKKIAICDLTEAELSSNGTVENRKKEAQNSAACLGVRERVTLKLPDRGLFMQADAIRAITGVIRKFQPDVVFAPFHEDRHPDHGNCGRLTEEAFFSAGIRKYRSEPDLPCHKPKHLYFYMVNGFHPPDFVVDVTNFMDKKLESLHAYESQFSIRERSVHTPLTDGYIEAVTARERMFGKELGVKYAEGFLSKKPVLVNLDVLDL
ncbi:bacillithiol biosynthesis deacetylase BshB1 [Heyndrickxia coagulans]|uniref:bacillithiol biosynthesis deacetylase BshB1 n=1 Tax=Heyndrickxia coagulans TaxID=1398 RepID=UPI0002DEBE7B|nr:bacillithiol biosynthesis deacetylase BshB1 [Heyndrickxia coagulans]